MRKFVKKGIVLFITLALLFVQVPAAFAYTAPVSTVKVGLFYGSSALASANLENVSDYGSGYELGYYDSNRNFVSLGGKLSETKLSMLMDRNMYTSASSGVYVEGTGGPIQVGCYHIKLNTAYSTYSEARAAADTFTSVNAFPRYENGSFYVCVGSYTNKDAATSAAPGLNIQQGYTIDSGTAYTITVVATNTGKILFEFDCGTSKNLGIRPLSNGSGKTLTWFKGYKYYGGFQYSRASGGAVTVINYVNVEDYVKGVIPYEMNASWPLEALKAQAVSARTYAMSHINAHSGSGFDMCNTTDCQVYHGANSANANSDSAVTQTASQYLMYNGSLCETYYCSSNGGATENSENVWVAALPYLRGVKDPYEADIADSVSNYYWKVTYTGEELAARLNSRGYSCSTIVKFEITKFTEMGNVLEIQLTDVNGKTITITKGNTRTVVGAKSQRYTVNGAAVTPPDGNIYVNSSSGTLDGELSSSYAVGSSGTDALPSSGDIYAITGSGTVESIDVENSSGGSASATPADGVFTITGTGSGHNVGMSQWGAYSMAKYHDKTCEDILTFYYTGSQIVTAS